MNEGIMPGAVVPSGSSPKGLTQLECHGNFGPGDQNFWKIGPPAHKLKLVHVWNKGMSAGTLVPVIYSAYFSAKIWVWGIKISRTKVPVTGILYTS